MNPNQLTALKTVEQAHNALKGDDKNTARQLAVMAAQLAPELEEVWLMMAALSAPRASIEYYQRALAITPDSLQAKNGLALTLETLRKKQVNQPQPSVAAIPLAVSHSLVDPNSKTSQPEKHRNRKRVIYAAGLGLVICLIAAAIIASSVKPVLALFSPASDTPTFVAADVSKSNPTLAPIPTGIPSFTLTPVPSVSFTPTKTYTVSPTLTASLTFTPVQTEAPTSISTLAASPTPLPTDTLEPLALNQPQELPATQAAAQTPSLNSPSNNGVHWIDVDLTNQMVYAYEGTTIVNSFLVSTGAAPRLTVTGSYHIYERHIKANMWGGGYFLPDVPYTMYFYKGYALHGTYWHSNFGTPMSHGCVNLSIPDAEWLYYWASMGTLVKIHY